MTLLFLMNLGFAGSVVQQQFVAGPYRVAAGMMRVAGAAAGSVSVAGAAIGEVFISTATAGQINGECG